MMLLCSLALAGVPGAELDLKMRSYIAPAVEAGRLQGVVVQWIRGDDDALYSYGTERGGDAVFEIGSISKAFTGELLAEAVLRGEVALDDTVSEHLPKGAPKWTRKVTLLQLATHTSGLPRMPEGFDGPADDPYASWDDDKLEAALETTVPGPPGVHAYSNLGAALLGRVLERAAQKDYPTLLRERITDPLGMAHTDVDGAKPVQGHDAAGRPVGPWTLGSFDAAGGIHSTPADLTRWVRAHFDEQSPTAKAMAMATHTRHAETTTSIGLLWHRNASMVWHNGQTGGYHALIAFTPGSKAGVVVLGDTATELVDQIGFAALQLLEGHDPEPLKMRAAKTYPDHYLVALAGTYGPVEVVHRPGGLWLQLKGQPPYRMWAEGPKRFYLLEAPVEIEFDQGRLVFEQSGMERQVWQRAPDEEP